MWSATWCGSVTTVAARNLPPGDEPVGPPGDEPVAGVPDATGPRGLAALVAVALVVGTGAGVLAHRATTNSGETLTEARADAPRHVDRTDQTEIDEIGGGTIRRPRVAVYGCPGGEAVGHLAHLDRIVLTATHVDHDGWIRTRDPMSPNTAWWIRSDHVDPDADLDALPAVECLDSFDVAAFDELGALLDDFEVFDEPDDTDDADETDTDEALPDPEPDTTAPATAPATTAPETAPETTAPTATTPDTGAATTTTVPPATTAPATTTTTSTTTTTTTIPAVVTWGSVTRQHATIREDFPGACDTNLPTTTQISTSVEHPAGISSVEFRHRVAGGAWSGWQTVATHAGQATGTVGPYAVGVAPPNGSVTAEWEFRATPAQGSAATLSSTGQNQVSVTYCGLS